MFDMSRIIISRIHPIIARSLHYDLRGRSASRVALAAAVEQGSLRHCDNVILFSVAGRRHCPASFRWSPLRAERGSSARSDRRRARDARGARVHPRVAWRQPRAAGPRPRKANRPAGCDGWSTDSPGPSIRSLLSFACVSLIMSMGYFVRPGLVAVADISATLRVRFPFRVPPISGALSRARPGA